MHYRSILEFWFAELPPSAWFTSSAELDSTIARRFGDIHQSALAGELYSWRHKPQGRLAEIIVLDQFSRNIYRDTPRAFAADGQALVLTQEALRVHADAELTEEQRVFCICLICIANRRQFTARRCDYTKHWAEKKIIALPLLISRLLSALVAIHIAMRFWVGPHQTKNSRF